MDSAVRQWSRLEPRLDDLGMGQDHRNRRRDIGDPNLCRGSSLGHC